MSLPALIDKAIVLHVVKDLSSSLEKAKRILTTNQSEISESIADSLPINSIICKTISIGKAQDSNQNAGRVIACYPLLSSHIMTPIKNGEEVWLMSFSEKSDLINNYYWLGRVHGSAYTEDTNFTAPFRKKGEIPDFENQTTAKLRRIENNTNLKTTPSFDNVITFGTQDAEIIPGGESAISSLIDKSSLEPVPRYQKNEDELVLQGSFNTLISLKKLTGNSSNRQWEGSDDSNEINNAIYDSNINRSNNNFGFIDIVAGRSRYNPRPTSNSSLSISDNNTSNSSFTTNINRTNFPTIINSLGRIENNKDTRQFLNEKYYNPNEGTADFYHDAARISISESGNIDSYLSISSELIPFKSVSIPQFNRSSVSSKADSIRIVARQDLFFTQPANYASSGSNSSIILLKEGTIPDESSKGTQSLIVQDSLGNIVIDGSQIILGNSIRQSSINGEGNQLLIGEDAVEPMVLGNTLKDLLDSICSQFLSFIDLFGNHVHAAPVGIAPALQTNNPQEIKQSVEEIKNNLETIKSKMAKLS